MNLSKFERILLDFMLAGRSNVLSILRQQSDAAHVMKRDETDEGFFTELLVSSKIPTVGKITARIGDVIGSHPDLKRGMGFLLFIDEGRIAALEAYTYNEKIPDSLIDIALQYQSGTERNLPKELK